MTCSGVYTLGTGVHLTVVDRLKLVGFARRGARETEFWDLEEVVLLLAEAGRDAPAGVEGIASNGEVTRGGDVLRCFSL